MDVVDVVAARVESKIHLATVLVAIDGGDEAGKTTFADALENRLEANHPVIRICGDNFENPRALRHRRGEFSAEGYFEDAYDYPAFESRALGPLRHGEPFVSAVLDATTDRPVLATPLLAPSSSVAIVDGLFLLRRQIRKYFDVAVYLEVSDEERLRRALERELARFASKEHLLQRFHERYLPGYQLYLEGEDPKSHADFVIDNEDPVRPKLIKTPA